MVFLYGISYFKLENKRKERKMKKKNRSGRSVNYNIGREKKNTRKHPSLPPLFGGREVGKTKQRKTSNKTEQH